MKYKAELNQLITVANNTLKRKGSMNQLSSNYAKYYGGYRITSYNEKTDIESELSPRMSCANICNWLNGFIEGLDF